MSASGGGLSARQSAPIEGIRFADDDDDNENEDQQQVLGRAAPPPPAARAPVAAAMAARADPPMAAMPATEVAALPMGQVLDVVHMDEEQGGLHYKRTTDGESRISEGAVTSSNRTPTTYPSTTATNDDSSTPTPLHYGSSSAATAGGYSSSSSRPANYPPSMFPASSATAATREATRTATSSSSALQQQQQQPRDATPTNYDDNNPPMPDEVEERGERPTTTTTTRDDGGGGGNNNGPGKKFRQLLDNLTYNQVVVGVVVTLVVLIAVVVGGVCGSGNCGRSKDPPAPTPTLEQIQERGLLRCGTFDVTIQTGETVTDGTDPIGFSEDMCKAVAAAIFGSATDRLEYVVVSPSNRFMELDAGKVDILAGSVTHTMERHVYEPTTATGFAFSIPYLYGGLTFGGIPPYGACADQLRNDDGSATNSTTDCSGVKVCVIDGTTFAKLVPSLIPGVSVVSSPNADSFYRSLREGRCNVLAGDQFETASTTVKQFAFFDDYEQGLDLHSKEPLSLVTRQDDPTWSDFVNWVVQGLLSAEEQKITQNRAHLFVKSKLFGEAYENMFINSLKEVGHYGELYERHLEPSVPRKPINMINDGTSGLIYAMPFGDVNPRGPDPVAGSTLQMIQDRGHLKCGVSRRAIFAKFDESTKQYSGFDIDFCRALAAAIFSGVANVVYTDLTAKDRFTALQTGKVDVLSRITTVTLSRDVLEPSTEAGFSFSQPNFYDGVGFGGIPPFGVCADTLKTSNECADLRICVNDATTSLATVQQLFPEQFIVVKESGDLAAQGLTTGECNAIAGGVFDVAVSNIRNTGKYTDDYEQGTGRYSKDPLALVTREDDPQWSAFVYWIVSAIFYAEEEGITASDSFKMPTVNLFGNVYFKMLKLAVEAVGSYAEIYDRHVEEEFARSGLNLLNSHPLQAQHYPLPGLQL